MFHLALVLTDLNATCGTPDYPRILKRNDSAMGFSLTQSGAKDFVECAIQSALIFAQQMPIPDLEFEVNLGVTSLRFFLKDVVFSDFGIKNAYMDFLGEPVAQAGVDGAYVVLTLKWGFTQTSYPYLSDQGDGQVFLNGVSFKTLVGCEPNYEDCPGHFNVLVQRADIEFDQMKIDLKGGSSWIYQSLINIILDVVSKDLSKIISNVLVEAIQALMNAMLNNDGFFAELPNHLDIIKDERFVDAWEIGVGYMSVFFSGYIYNMKNLTDEFIQPSMLKPITQNLVNNQMVYSMSEAAFNNLFYIMHKYFDLYSGETYKMLEPPTLEIMNANTLIKCKLEHNGRTVNMQLTGKPAWKTTIVYDERKKMNVNRTQVSFTFKHYSNDYPRDQDQSVIQDLIKMVVARMQKAIEEAPYQLNVTPFIDFSYFYVLYDRHEKSIRWVGDNPDECAPLSK